MTAKNTAWCIHYTGIMGRAGEPGPRERRCAAGVLYDSVRQPGSIPCISQGTAECALREFPSQAEVDADFNRALERLEQAAAVITAGRCPHCGRDMTKRKVGRCLYAQPCPALRPPTERDPTRDQGGNLMPYFCPGCGWHLCRCDDWRELERRRENKHLVTWTCTHTKGDRSKTYNGIGLRRALPLALGALESAA